jgi:hypothetical protein
MTGARGVVIASLVAVAVTSTHAVYRLWPATHGMEICVPAALYRQPVQVGVVQVGLPMSRIELDVPHTAPAVTEPFESVRAIGGWWVIGGDARANSRALRGRPLYLQLTAGEPVMPGGPAVMRLVTVSDAAVSGATNVAGAVLRVREDGYIWLDYPVGWISVPRDVESKARPLDAPGPRGNITGPIPPAADPGVYAVLRVLPSGRSALVGVIVSGKRY